MKIVIAIAMSVATVAMTWLGASPASAHTPVISADCAGVHVQATAYDAGQQNQWSVTIGGATQSGTFGASFDQTFPVPQDGATTSWSASASAQDGSYPGQGSGSVGPCGTPPPPTDECADLPGDQPAGTSCTPPPAIQTAESTNQSVCGQDVVVTSTLETTTPYVFDAQTNEWVLGEPQEQTTTSETPVTAEECDETGVSPHVVETDTSETVHVVRSDVPVKAEVPTFVDSGLAGVAPAAATVVPREDRQVPTLALLLTGSALVLVGGLRLRRS